MIVVAFFIRYYLIVFDVFSNHDAAIPNTMGVQCSTGLSSLHVCLKWMREESNGC